MDMKVFVYDIEKICRTCLKEQNDNMISVFQVDCEFGENVEISEIITNLTSIQIINEEGLPYKICCECLEDIKKFNSFTKHFHEVDAKLRYYQQVLLNAKPEDIKEVTVTNEIYSDEPEYLLEEKRELDIVNYEFIDDKSNDGTDIKIKRDYTCLVCNMTFKTAKKLTVHKNTHESHSHICEKCGKEYSDKVRLKVHMRSHFTEEERPFKCDQCERQYAYEYQLTQHMYKHSDVKPFPCPHCGKGCLTADSLKRHMKTHNVDYEKRKHKCNICHKEFAYPSFLAEHMKNHTGEKPFLCSYCGRGFRQKGALQYHIRVHTGNKPYSCETCKSTFISQGVLKVHMRTHTDERPYICDICGRAFRRCTDMRGHRRTHTGEKPVQCTVCFKKMSTTGQLTIHMRSHTGEKPYSCNYCNKAFSTKSLVVKHERIHTGEKPYVCSTCGKAFSQSSSLNIHTKTHRRTDNLITSGA